MVVLKLVAAVHVASTARARGSGAHLFVRGLPSTCLAVALLATLQLHQLYVVDGTADEASGLCGGWACPTLGELPAAVASRGEGSFGFCDLAVLDAAGRPGADQDPSVQEPAVFRAAGLLAEFDLTRHRVEMAAKETKALAKIGYSWELVQHQGEGGDEEMLQRFLDDIMHHDRYDEDLLLEHQYVFDTGFELIDYLLPGLESLQFSLKVGAHNLTKSDYGGAIITLGGPQSGVSWHRHNTAIELVAHGRKRWLLYPPTKTPPGGANGGWSILDWLFVVYPALGKARKPLECILEAGDAIHVPEGWYHAVVNLADTVAVSLQQTDTLTEHKRLLDEVGSTPPEKHAKLFAQVLKLHPSDRDTLFFLAANLLQKKPDRGVKYLRKLVKSDPFHIEAMFMLFRILTQSSGDSKQQVVSTFRDFIPYLQNNTRSLLANEMLAYYSSITGDPQAELAHLQRNAYLQVNKFWSGTHLPTDWQAAAAEAKHRLES